ncbi:SnoaL-like domain-containing protein [Balamuthia mandrillaris]
MMMLKRNQHIQELKRNLRTPLHTSLSKDEQELVRNVMNLYDSTAAKDKQTISTGLERFYSKDAVFSDPILQVTGRNNMLVQFSALRKLFYECTPQLINAAFVKNSSSNTAGGQDVLMLHLIMDYRVLKAIPLRLQFEQFTVLYLSSNPEQTLAKLESGPVAHGRAGVEALEEMPIAGDAEGNGKGRGKGGASAQQRSLRNQKVIYHQDSWDVASLMEGLPIIGFIFAMWKLIIGMLTSWIFTRMC